MATTWPDQELSRSDRGDRAGFLRSLAAHLTRSALRLCAWAGDAREHAASTWRAVDGWLVAGPLLAVAGAGAAALAGAAGVTVAQRHASTATEIATAAAARRHAIDVVLVRTAVTGMQVAAASAGAGVHQTFRAALDDLQSQVSVAELKGDDRGTATALGAVIAAGNSLMATSERSLEQFAEVAREFEVIDTTVDTHVLLLAARPGAPNPVLLAWLNFQKSIGEVGTWLGHFRRTGTLAYRARLVESIDEADRALGVLIAVPAHRGAAQAASLSAHVATTRLLVREIIALDDRRERHSRAFVATIDQATLALAPGPADTPVAGRSPGLQASLVAVQVIGVGAAATGLLLFLARYRRDIVVPTTRLATVVGIDTRRRSRPALLLALGETAARNRDTLSSAIGEGARLRDTVDLLVNARERIDRQQWLATAGELAQGIAHDLNNHLMAARGFAGLIAEAPDLPAQARGDLAQLDAALSQAGQVSRQLTRTTTVATVAPVSLNALAAEMADMTRRLFGRRLDVLVQVTEADDTVQGDITRIRQAVTNLVMNARDAMARGGTITFEVAVVAGQATSDRRSLDVAPGHVAFRVRDTGDGCRPDDIGRVFEPFFSTKGTRGTGLGMAQVAGIMAQHGGVAHIESEEGRGTTVSLQFPRGSCPTCPSDAVPAPLSPARDAEVGR